MSSESKNISIGLGGGFFWGVVFIVLAFTGNCAACGLDHDYMSDWMECSDK